MTGAGVTGMRVLVLDGHSKAAAETVLALPRACRIDVAANPDGALAFASRRVVGRLRQPGDTTEFRSWIAALDDAADYRLIVASTEASLIGLKSESLAGPLRRKAVLPCEASIDTALSKQRTTDLARTIGVPVPKTAFIASPEDVGNAPAYPLVVKPVHSKVMIGGRLQTLAARVCADAGERHAAHAALLPHTAVLEQEYFGGRGIGVEALFENGEPRWLFAHERLHELPVTGGASTYRRAFEPPRAVREAAVSLLAHLRWHGVAMVEFKLSESGDFRLIEINPRLWGSLPLAVAAGVNFPLGLLRIACGEDVGPQPRSRRMHMRDPAADARWFVQSWRRRGDPLLVKPLRIEDVLAPLRLLIGTERWDLFRWGELELWRALSAPAFDAVSSRVSTRFGRLRTARAAARVWRHYETAWTDGAASRVVVLCYGNICRSPLAAALLGRSLPDVETVSAGFHERDGRSPPEDWTATVSRSVDVDLRTHRSRVVDDALLEWADLILVMDADNWRSLAQRFPKALGKATLLSHASPDPEHGRSDIEDPYGRPAQEQDAVARRISRAVHGLADRRSRAASHPR